MRYRNSEGYADPTAGAALAQIEYEERLKKRLEKKKRRNTTKKRRLAAENRIRSRKKNDTHFQEPCVKAWPSVSDGSDSNPEEPE